MEKWSCVQQAFPDGRHCLRGWGEVVNQTDTVPVCRDVSTSHRIQTCHLCIVGETPRNWIFSAQWPIGAGTVVSSLL